MGGSVGPEISVMKKKLIETEGGKNKETRGILEKKGDR